MNVVNAASTYDSQREVVGAEAWLLGNPRGRSAIPQGRPASRTALRILPAMRRLAGLHLRITLFHIALPTGLTDLDLLSEAVHDPSLVVEVAPTGLLVLALGPRLPGFTGDTQVAARVCQEVALACGQFGLARRLRLSVMHCWSDSVDDPQALIGELVSAPIVTIDNLLMDAA